MFCSKAQVILVLCSILPFIAGRISRPINKERQCVVKCVVPLVLNFQCASNGVTYMNEQELKCAKKKCFPDLSLSHPGKCRPQELEKTTKITEKKKVVREDRHCKMDCLCDYGNFPVCGSNRVTYMNDCYLKCAQNCSPGLKRIHSGYCTRPKIDFPQDDPDDVHPAYKIVAGEKSNDVVAIQA